MLDPLFMSMIPALVWGGIIGGLAARKNRSGLGWGIVAGACVFFFVGCCVAIPSQRKGVAQSVMGVIALGACAVGLAEVIILAFVPYQCPICRSKLSREQRRTQICPACGSFQRAPEDQSSCGAPNPRASGQDPRVIWNRIVVLLGVGAAFALWAWIIFG